MPKYNNCSPDSKFQSIVAIKKKLTWVELRLKFDNEIVRPLMSGIIAGYNYDIFISYRQKDNKGDREMSEFVVALKTELESALCTRIT